MARRKKDVAAEKTGFRTEKQLAELLDYLGLTDALTFYINGRYCLKGLMAYRALKTKYGNDFDDMFSDMPTLKPLHSDFVQFWDDLEPVKISDVMKLSNDANTRREIFQFFPTRLLFVDAQVVHNTMKITTQVDENGVERTVENIYKLVRKKATDILGREVRINPGREYIYAVKVECVTTGKDYYLMVDPTADFCKEGKFNAAAAVAWTALCPISNPKGLIRQGEVMIWLKNKDSRLLNAEDRKHLTEQEYFSLLQFQS